MNDWSPQQSADLYGIQHWGAGHFRVNDDGEVAVQLPGGEVSVPLPEIARGLRERGFDMPVLLRVENHLEKGIRRINETFAEVIDESSYQGHYRGVFPIKVNQQSQIIEEVVQCGRPWHHGLEAGSKAELLVAMAMLDDDERLIICNGYKDGELIDLALRARQLGRRCFLVAESRAELDLVIERSRALGIAPLLGVRVKLSTRVDGHWSSDSGDRSLFGLTATQLIDVVDRLRDAEMLDCLQLLHYHIGSQIPNIRNIRDGVREACRYYGGLLEEGAPLGYLDLGGGLAVDYDGTRGGSGHSRNYSLREYCADIVEGVQEAMDPAGIPHPHLVTESGRATVAYTSVLLFNILDVATFHPEPVDESLPEDAPDPLKYLLELIGNVTPRNMQESYNDATYYRDQAREMFQRGDVNLRLRSLAERMYLAVMQEVAVHARDAERLSAELEALPGRLADIYYGNFSVFQSLPDAWAIQQVFPVMPIHRLDEEPTRLAVIADLTCDCDGKLDHFATGEGVAHRLPLHPLRDDEEYDLGVFLVGAYQETLGDLHNLFGDTHVASVRINDDGSFDFIHELHGDSIADVLSYVEYQPDTLYRRFRDSAEAGVRSGRITVAQRQQMLGAFSESLRGYTYFER